MLSSILKKYNIHKHKYTIKVAFKEVENADYRYSMRKYKCEFCEKTKWVDGRFDNN